MVGTGQSVQKSVGTHTHTHKTRHSLSIVSEENEVKKTSGCGNEHSKSESIKVFDFPGGT